MMKKKGVVNRKYAQKRGDYGKVIANIETLGKCPFCPDNFIYHKKKILRKERGWFITPSSWPYKKTRCHFLLISEKHKENFSELTIDDFRAIQKLTRWVIKKYNIKGGALNIRFGDTNYTGASVCHLHFHLISPQKNKSVVFPIG